MSISGVQTIPGTGSSTESNEANSAADSTQMDKDAFMKLLLAQLQNQDPLSPMEGTEFVSQLAEFTSVEQALAQTSKLELISLQLTGLAANEAVGLIGKEVTVRGNKISFDGQNATGFSANLDGAAADVTVTIRDASTGAAVRTMELGQQKAGTLSVPWDGRDNNGQLAAAGSYRVEVSATDASGSSVQVSQDVTGTVVGVSFDKGYPEIVLDSGATAPISDLISVNGQPTSPTPVEPVDDSTPNDTGNGSSGTSTGSDEDSTSSSDSPDRTTPPPDFTEFMQNYVKSP